LTEAREERSIVADLICGKTIESSSFMSDGSIYDLIDYYEMNLYFCSDDREINSQIQQIWAENNGNIKKFTGEIAKIATRLEDLQISYCILAGIPLAERYHDMPTLRLQEDVDFYVDEKDLYSVREIMQDLAYYEVPSAEDKKHVTFINEGYIASDLSLEGRCAVKFYRRMSSHNFCQIKYCDVKGYIENYNSYKVLSKELTLLHLLFHAHFYDMHPKVLADIYMVCKNGNLDWDAVNWLVQKYEIKRVADIIFTVMAKLGLSMYQFTQAREKDIDFISDMLVSRIYWEKIFPKMNAKEMTAIRAYFYDVSQYRTIYKGIFEKKQERRVSPMRDEFK